MTLIIGSTTGSTSNTGSSSSSQSTSDSLASGNMNEFLQILMTQLENQSPLDPVDTSQFTSQLAEYSSVEQQVDTNTKLDSLISLMGGNGNISPISYLGTTVDLNSDSAPVQNGAAQWTYTLPSDAQSATLTVTDADGNVVYTGNADTTAGSHTFSYADTTDDGLTLNVTATDKTGAAITTTVNGRAVVDAVDSSTGTTYLQAGAAEFLPSTVMRISQTPTGSTNTSDTDTSTNTNSNAA